MKRIVLFGALVGAMTSGAQVLTPETGVANDHGYGLTRSVSVAYEPRTLETGYGYEDGMTVFGLTLLPWSFPNESWDVTGVRMNLGWGAYRDTTGLDIGLFSSSRNADGVFFNLFGTYTTGDSRSLQCGLANVVSQRMCGVQIGLVNYADHLDGVQIGLLNFARSQWFFPIINIGW